MAANDGSYTFARERFERCNSASQIMNVACVVLAVLVGTASFFGLREIVGENGGGHGIIIPLTVAVGGGLLFWVGWHMLFRFTPLTEHAPRRNTLLVAGAVLVLLQLMFSAWPVATAVSSSSVVTAHLTRHVNLTREALQRATKRVNEQIELVDLVERNAAQYAAHAKNEAAHGSASGKRGEGVVTAALSSLSEQLYNAARQMKDVLSDATSDREAAMKKLREMQNLIATTTSNSAARQKEFANLAASVSDVISHMNEINLGTKMTGVIGGIAHSTKSVKDSDVINSSQRSVEKIGEEVRNAAMRLQNTSEPVLAPAFAPINAGSAVLEYASEVAPGWAISIGVDLLPYILLIILVIMWKDVRTINPQRHSFGEPIELLHHEPSPYSPRFNHPGRTDPESLPSPNQKSADVIPLEADKKKPQPRGLEGLGQSE